MPVATVSRSAAPAQQHLRQGQPDSQQQQSQSQSQSSQTHHRHPHQRRDEHKPRTTAGAGGEGEEGEEETHYVLTLRTTPAMQRTMDALRAAWFPPRLLKVGAHVSLFRALPGSRLPAIRRDIASSVANMMGGAGTGAGTGSPPPPPPQLRIAAAPGAEAFRLGRPGRGGGGGVALPVSGPGIAEARRVADELRGRWRGFLSDQDRAGTFSRRRGRGPGGGGGGGGSGESAHYTVLNKSGESEVERCLGALSQEFGGCEGEATGLDLWRYDRGWWRHEETFAFGGGSGG